MEGAPEGPQQENLIFIVEPDPEARSYFEQIFREGGWQIVASDGTDSLPGREEEPPAIILVCGGRESFDEIDFIRKVRSHSPTENTPIVVLANHLHNDFAVDALKEGADDVATGPFSKSRLLARVNAHVSLAQLRREEEEQVPKAFEQLRLSEHRYRSLVSATSAIVWVSTSDGRVVEEISTWEQFTGQPWETYNEFGWLSAVHSDDREGLRGLWKKAVDQGQDVVDAEFRLRRRDGEYRHMHLKAIPVRNKKEHLYEWVGTVGDITERRQAEEALRESEQRMRLILESSTDFAIFTIDREGKVTSWNAGAEQLLGYAEEEICETDFHRIFLQEDVEAGAPDEEMENALKTGRGIDQRWHVRKDGSQFWADGLLMPLRDEQNNVFGFLKIVRDFTEQKKSQDKLRTLTEELEQRVDARTKELEESRARLRSLIFQLNKAEQMERQRIAAELHDSLAQLLTAGRLSLESAIREIGDGGPLESLSDVRKIISESTRITRNLMSELSGPPVLEHDDLVSTVQWVVDRFRKDGLTLELSANEDRIPLERDLLTLLFQSVRELLLNVIKHSGVSEASISIQKVSDKVEIEVADKGRGFVAKEQPGYPGNEEGFGLLNIHERLRWLGGTLEIDAAPGRGTRSKLCLPLNERNLQPPADGEQENRRRGKRKGKEKSAAGTIRVLLVDDHCMIREGFRSVISRKPDIRIVGEAVDGLEALEKARTLRPDVVIMDINMPRMNGLEATRRLRDEMPEISVVGLSLYGRDDMAEAIIKAGASAYVSKEDAFDILCDVIRTQYRKKHAEQPSAE